MTYLGRPWADYARVVWKSTTVDTTLESALWSEWSSSTPNTDHVTYLDYATEGTYSRPSWATQLTSSQAASYTLSSALGGDTSWIDSDYLI